MKKSNDGTTVIRLGNIMYTIQIAVVNLMLEGEFQSYWSGTASYEAIVPLINMDFDGLKSAVIEMLSGDHVPVDVTSFQNDTVSFAIKTMC